MNNVLTLNFPFSMGQSIILRRRSSLRFFWPISLLLIGVLLVLYIFQINSTIQQTYIFQNYEKKLGELRAESENLDVYTAKSVSLENLEKLVQNLNYEKSEKITYIQVPESQVVTKTK